MRCFLRSLIRTSCQMENCGFATDVETGKGGDGTSDFQVSVTMTSNFRDADRYESLTEICVSVARLPTFLEAVPEIVHNCDAVPSGGPSSFSSTGCFTES